MCSLTVFSLCVLVLCAIVYAEESCTLKDGDEGETAYQVCLLREKLSQSLAIVLEGGRYRRGK